MTQPKIKKRYTDQSVLDKIENDSQKRHSIILDHDFNISSSELINTTNAIDPNFFKNELKTLNEAKRAGIIKIGGERPRFVNGLPKSSLGDIKLSYTESILDNSIKEDNPFIGVFVLFWVGVSTLVLHHMIHHYLDYGFRSEIIDLFFQDIIKIGINDLILYLATYFVFFLHLIIKKNYINWEINGWIISSIYEIIYFIFFTIFIERQNYPWIGKIFLFLHSLVLLMKMHSYSFYNGYLWKINNELKFSENFFAKYQSKIQKYDPKIYQIIEESIKFCQFEISSQSKVEKFPSNINFKNYFQFTMFPTLVYQIDYPRTNKIRWGYVVEKLFAILGVISLMIIIVQNSLYQIGIRAINLKNIPIWERFSYFPMLLLDFIPSFFLVFLLNFYLIWDAILNCIAELTRFGDRYFYGPFWNCISWDEFSRLWNPPVHKFLLRHVYHSSISAFNLNKNNATLLTFLISSIVHELSMYVLFGKFRGYIFFFQMFQLPLIYISKSQFLKKKKILGNVMFWFGMVLGPALVACLYLTF